MPGCENVPRVVCERNDGKTAIVCIRHYTDFVNEGVPMTVIGSVTGGVSGLDDDTDGEVWV